MAFFGEGGVVGVGFDVEELEVVSGREALVQGEEFGAGAVLVLQNTAKKVMCVQGKKCQLAKWHHQILVKRTD